MFLKREQCADLHRELVQKAVTTLGEELASKVVVPVDCIAKLLKVLQGCRTHTAMCVFKCIIGGWTTSHRMHEPVKHSCLLGCAHANDDIRHYLLCSPLWQIAGQALGAEPPLDLAARLCLVEPCTERARLLALTFQLYHFGKAQVKAFGGPQFCGSNHVQSLLVEASRALKNHV